VGLDVHEVGEVTIMWKMREVHNSMEEAEIRQLAEADQNLGNI